MPCALVVTNGWNSRSAISGAMPGPVSMTLISTSSSSIMRGLDRQLAPRAAFHRLDGVADEIDQHLLDLNLVDQHVAAGSAPMRKRTVDAALLGADQRERARLLDQLEDVLGVAARLRLSSRTRAADG